MFNVNMGNFGQTMGSPGTAFRWQRRPSRLGAGRNLFRGKRGLAIGGGALALTAYEMSKRRSSGRNGIQPSSSGGYGMY